MDDADHGRSQLVKTQRYREAVVSLTCLTILQAGTPTSVGVLLPCIEPLIQNLGSPDAVLGLENLHTCFGMQI